MPKLTNQRFKIPKRTIVHPYYRDEIVSKPTIGVVRSQAVDLYCDFNSDKYDQKIAINSAVGKITDRLLRNILMDAGLLNDDVDYLIHTYVRPPVSPPVRRR